MVGGELGIDGAVAVVLTGSHARGNSHATSDIDLHAIGSGPPYQLVRREPYLVSISWRTAEQHRASFGDIHEVGGAVPGWRSAVILADPRGIAAELQREARDWSWNRLGREDEINRSVAEWIAGFAVEVQKLAFARAQRNDILAGVQRSVLATRLALPVAVYHRILHDSENDLWRLVCEAMGSEWTIAQHASLQTDGQSFAASCDAAVRLFALACEVVRPSMTSSQAAVVDNALAVGRDRR